MPRLTTAALATLWVVPTALLIRRNSAWSPVAAAALAICVASIARWRPVAQAPADESLVLSPPLEIPPWRPLFHLALAGALINLALVAEGMRRSVAASVFVAVAAAIVMARSSPEQRERTVGRLRRTSPVLALLLTLIALVQWGAGRWLPPEDGSYPGAAEASSVNPSTPDLSFRGVILFVEKPPERIVPPSPLTLKPGFADPSREPLVIPFSGVYWFMRAPDRLPPSTSLIQHGSPDELFYRAADWRPLVMEAHQHLGRHISLECCSGIDADINNIDRFPGSVHVELLVTNTDSGSRLSLGTLPVLSTEFKMHGELIPRKETLRYSISPSRFGSFDEITVRFHLNGTRNAQSARMAIERFTLRPR